MPKKRVYKQRPPRRAEKPNTVSLASYWHEGKRHLRKALAAQADPIPLAQIHEDDVYHLLHRSIASGGPYAVKTRLRYREDLKWLLLVLARARKQDFGWVEFTLNKLDDLMRAKNGKKRDRTRLATRDDVKIIFADLRDRYRKATRLNLALCVFMIAVIQRTGMRPAEIPTAKVKDSVLIIKNAKRVLGDPVYRSYSLVSMPKAFIEILPWAFTLFPFQSQHQFDRMRNRLAETLARACARNGIERLSLYSFRRLRISIWIEAGAMAEAVAVLAGHRSKLTAKRHYYQPVSGSWGPSDRQIPDLAEIVEPDSAPTDDNDNEILESPKPKMR